ncbi:6646_t:CDS:10 [Paraglomus brasilianum]|uniref:6646_t:CDS:1 n=1 Tax=Paraglomus brasilianum TaxID=144538 RepID=A0A9N9B9Q4_9GLOM|nr:6646_t:CDS:10 [Paraglomus brasilianum]
MALRETNNWSNDTFNVSLATLAAQVFADVLTRVGADKDKFNEFVKSVEKSYNSENPYHNAFHAGDVLQSAYFFTQQQEIKEILSDLDVLTLLFAALVHDIDHPGLSADFLLRIEHNTEAVQELKLNRYFTSHNNRRNFLEHYHVVFACDLLFQEKHNFLQCLNDNDLLLFTGRVTDLILSTDMADHDLHLSEFQKILSTNSDIGKNDIYKLSLMKIIIKACDIGHPAKPLEMHKKWSGLVMNEMQIQSEKQRLFESGQLPLMEHNNDKKINAEFLKLKVIPLFETLSQYVSLEIQVKQLYENLYYWES